MAPIVVTEGLTKDFAGRRAVDGLSLEIESGEMFGLVGPNGAGKTTTIRLLTTLLIPSAGSARVAGYDLLRQAAAIRGAIGCVPQGLSVDGSLTAYENLLVFAKLYRVPREQRQRRMTALLELVQLADRAHSLVRTFSGGMIRRLELALALVHRPRLLFLDEPTAGLDPVARRTFWEHLKELQTEEGLSIVLTTHYLEEAEALCDRLAIMHLGRVQAVGSVEELKRKAGAVNAGLEEAFVRFTGESMIEAGGGSYLDVRRTRRLFRRLG